MSKEYPSAVFTKEQYEALMKKQQQKKNNRQTVEKITRTRRKSDSGYFYVLLYM